MASRFHASLLIFAAFASACAAPPHASGDVNYFVVSTRSHAVVRASFKVPARAVLEKIPLFYMKTSYGATSTWKAASVSRRGDDATIVVVPARPEATPKLDDAVIIYFYEATARDPIVLLPLPPLPRQQVRFPVPTVVH
jgi:hypothetical protein